MAFYRYDQTSNKLIPITSEGSVGIPVGAVMAFAQGTTHENWLLCDGRDTTGTADELQTHYPALYTYLGNTNVLPDYRECVLVGVGQNDTDTIAEHDVYTLGEFKDDQFQGHEHKWDSWVPLDDGGGYENRTGGNGFGGLRGTKYISAKSDYGTPRVGTTTHGKQKGVAFYIKATSAGIEVDKDLYATKGYIREQNVLSDYETVAITTTDTTMDYDGYLYISVSGGPSPQSYALLINSDTYSLQNDMIAGGTYANGSYCFPFRKGDKIHVGVNAPASYKAQFYKLRDYTGR